MKEYVEDMWWLMLLRGLALLFLGIMAVIWPQLTLVILALFLSIYLFIAGVIDIVTSVGSMKTKRAWFLITLLGVLEVGVGIFLLSNPALSIATYIFVIGAIILIQGVMIIISALAHTEDAGLKFLALIGGVLAIIAGFFILRNPAEGGVAFVWILGAYGIIGGAFEIAAALSLKSAVKEAQAARQK